MSIVPFSTQILNSLSTFPGTSPLLHKISCHLSRFTQAWVCSCSSLLVLISNCSVVQSCLTLWDPMIATCQAPCPSLSPGAYSNSCPSCWWCHPTISCSVVPFSSCLQSFPASGSFLMSQLFTSGGQSTGASASASVLPMNI